MVATQAAAFCSGRLGKEGVDGAQEGLLVALGQLVDGLEAAGKAATGRLAVGSALLQSQELIGRDLEDVGQGDDGLAVKPQLVALPLGDKRLGDAETLGHLPLTQAPLPAQPRQALADGLLLDRLLRHPRALPGRSSLPVYGRLRAGPAREGATHLLRRIWTTGATGGNFDTGAYQYDGVGNVKRMGHDDFGYQASGRLKYAEVACLDGGESSCHRQRYEYGGQGCGNLFWVETRPRGGAPVAVQWAVSASTNCPK